MKRTRTQAFGASRGGVRKIRKGNRNRGFIAPRTTYPGGFVPLATRGYRPNTVERKVYDVAASTVDADTTGSIACIGLPILGTDMTNRVGRKICWRTVQARGLVRVERAELMTAASIPAQYVRFMLVIDMQPNGALPAITDILTTAHPASPLNLNNRDRFRVIADKEFTLDPYYLNTTATTSAASMTNQIKMFKIYKKVNLETIFNGTNGGTIADISSGALLRVIIGNQAISATNTAEFTFSTRCRFTDI